MGARGGVRVRKGKQLLNFEFLSPKRKSGGPGKREGYGEKARKGLMAGKGRD